MMMLCKISIGSYFFAKDWWGTKNEKKEEK
jgi:hypothetical protein